MVQIKKIIVGVVPTN